MKHLTARPNNPALAGQLASRRVSFGTFSRFAVAAVHTRFDAVSFFVWDAERADELTGLPAVVRQADSLEAAIAGLEDSQEDLQAE